MSVELDLMEYVDDAAAQAAYEDGVPVSCEFDFEGAVGTCPVGWTCTGTDCEIMQVPLTNIHGVKYLRISLDTSVGSATSPAFILPANIDHLRVLRAGGADAPSGIYVKKVSDDSTIGSSLDGQDSDGLIQSDIDLSAYPGVKVYIYVVDNRTGSWSKVYVDYFRCQDSGNSNIPITTAIQAFSESTIKQQGSYSLKVVAKQTISLNKTLTRTIT